MSIRLQTAQPGCGWPNCISHQHSRFPSTSAFPREALTICPNPCQALFWWDSTSGFHCITLCHQLDRSWERHQWLCGGIVIIWMLWPLSGQILQSKTPLYVKGVGAHLQVKSLLALISWECDGLALKLEVWSGCDISWRRVLVVTSKWRETRIWKWGTHPARLCQPPLPFYYPAFCPTLQAHTRARTHTHS